MLKILDLCAGTQSVKKAYPDCDYRGVDIYSPEGENIILDLLQEDIVEKLLEKLGDWRPDVIWASPVCNKLSVVITGEGGNYYFEVKDKEIKPRENWNIKVQPHMQQFQNEEGWKQAREDAIIAVKLHENIKKIIDYFNVPFAIENPAYALSQYLYKDYEKNVAHYCMYGFDYQKPTAIYAKNKLDLHKCNKKCSAIVEMGGHASLVGGAKKNKPRHWNSEISVYANRSSVPPRLIESIINQITSKLCPDCKSTSKECYCNVDTVWADGKY